MTERSTAETIGAGRVDPRYAVVFGAALTQFTIIGLLYSYGVLFKEFETEFGWSRTVLSACNSVSFLAMGLLAYTGGRLNDRYGPRAVLTVTGAAFSLGFILISQVSQPWHLFAVFAVFIGLGLATHDVVTLGTVARWFVNRRGIMTGVVKTGTATGQMLIPPAMAFAVVALGWRMAVVAMGILAAVFLLMAALAMRAPPQPVARGSRAPAADEGASFADMRRSRVFWTLCAIQFLFFPALTTVPLHVVVHGMDMGMGAALAAGLLSVQGAASVAGRLTVGTLTDRIRGRNGYIICFLPFIAALSALLVIHTPALLFAAVAVYGFAHGGFFTVVSPTIAEYFGTRAHGAAFGAIVFFGTIGGTVGPIVAGRVFDQTGSYFWAFAGLAVMAVAGLALVLSLPRRGLPSGG